MAYHDLTEQIIAAGGYAPPITAAMLATTPSPPPAERIATTNVLDPATWRSLYDSTPRITTELAIALATTRLPAELIDHALTHERRARPLAALISHNALTPTQLNSLRKAKLITPKVAAALVIATWLDSDSKRCLAQSHPSAHTAWLRTASPTDLPDHQLVAGLVELTQTLSATAAHDQALEALERRPWLLSTFVTHRCPALPTAAAASRHLTSEIDQRTLAGLDRPNNPRWLRTHARQLNKLARNPRTRLAVCTELVDRASADPQLGAALSASLLRLAQRVEITGDYATLSDKSAVDVIMTIGSVWDKAALAPNPNLPLYRRTMLALDLIRSHVRSPLIDQACTAHSEVAPPRTITNPSDWQLVFSPPSSTDLAVLARYTESRLGTDAAAWQLFMALGDNFTGTLGSFTELCVKLG